MKLITCNFQEATHVFFNCQILEIKEKIGIRNDGTLKPPSEGGFAVITTDGETLNMWQVSLYLKERT